MGTTTMGCVGFRARVRRNLLGLYMDNGKDYGNYYIIIG